METRGLVLSILGCLSMAVLGFTFAHWTGSESIFLDGVFSLVSFVMSLVMLVVSRIIRRAFRDAMVDIPGENWSLSIGKTGRSLYLHARILLDEAHHNAGIVQVDEWRELLTERMAEFVAEQEFDVVFTTDASYIG